MDIRAFSARVLRHLKWRLGKALDLPRYAFRRHLSRALNDRLLARRHKLVKGDQPLGGRIVIYAIYAPKGLSPSHLEALVRIAQAGYSAVVVANCQLSDPDRAALARNASLILDRVNFGYDFGAYRDGLRLIGDQLPHLRRLVLANDSVWLSLPGKPNWFSQAEAMDADFVGGASNLGVVALPPEHWRDQAWIYDRSLPGYHLCSFLLSFRPRVFLSEEFAQFWARFPLSNNKFWVVRNGEVELSRRLHAAGFTSATTTPLHDLGERLGGLTDNRLRLLLDRLIIPEDANLRALREKVRNDPSVSREQVEAFILHAVAATGPAYALADLAIRDLDQSFLKKTPLVREPSGAAASVAILSDIGADEVLAEALAMTRR